MLKLSQPNISEQALSAVIDVLRSGLLVHNSENEAFEQELANYLGCKEVILVSSGTAALHIALLTLDIGHGDAVLIPDFTFPATGNVVVMTGARPVIVDVTPLDYNISISSLKQSINDWKGPERLRAIMPVHEFGCPAELELIGELAYKQGLSIIEDAACALGAKYLGSKIGSFSNIACFSFHPRKTLTTGEGGAIATNNADLARRMRRLRNHGIEKTPEGMCFIEPALNYRMTNFQAALGRHQLPELDKWIRKRTELAQCYHSLLTPMEDKGLLSLPKLTTGHSWQTFMVVLNNFFDRNHVITRLKLAGVESNLGAQSLSALGIFGAQQPAKIGRTLFEQGLALPLHEQMSEIDIQLVCSVLFSELTNER